MPAGAVIISGVLISASSNAVASCACSGGPSIERQCVCVRASNAAAFFYYRGGTNENNFLFHRSNAETNFLTRPVMIIKGLTNMDLESS